MQTELMLKQSLQEASRYGEADSRFTDTLDDLSLLYTNKLSNLLAAEQLLKRSLEIREKTLWVEHPDLCLDRQLLATVYEKEGKLQEAEQLWATEYFVEKRLFKPFSPRLLDTIWRYALLEDRLHKLSDVERLLRENLAIAELMRHDKNNWLLYSLLGLASVEVKLKKPGEAERHYKRVLPLALKFNADLLPQVLSGLRNIYVERKQIQELFMLCKVIHTSDAQKSQELRLELASTLMGLAQQFLIAKNTRQSRLCANLSLKLQNNLRPANHHLRIETLSWLSTGYEQENDLAKAETTRRAGYKEARRYLPKSDSYLAATLSNLGSVYMLKEDPARARPAFVEALTLAKAARPANIPLVKQITDKLKACSTPRAR